MRLSKQFILSFLGLSACVVLSGITLLAQIAGNGVIQGLITDPTGAVIPRAEVVATNVATGARTTRYTTTDGFYVLSPLPPGEYTVTASAKGFQATVQQHVEVNALTVASVNLVLKVGETTQQVTVSAAPPQLDTSNGTLGVTISNESYTSLPLAMSGGPKSPEGFIYLLPGVQNGNGFVGNINGGAAFSKEIYINGLPVTTPVLNGDNRNLNTATSVEVVDQFQIDTNGTPAYYEGQGVENFVLKSGTNQLHGDIYEFLRNTALDTRGFFSSNVPVEIQNEFGAAVGGPIKKNRLFFFANYDGYRIRQGAVPSFYSLPTQAERNGDFSALPTPIYNPFETVCDSTGVCVRPAFPGNVIPQSLISPISKNLQSFLPSTINQNVQNNFLNAFTGGTDQNDYTIKIDANVSSKNHLYGVTQWGKNFPTTLGANGGPQLPLPYSSSRYADTITSLDQFGDDYTLTPNVLNVFGFSFNRFNNPYFNPTTKGNYAVGSGLKGLPPGQASEAFPPVAFFGPNSPTAWAQNLYDVGFYEITNSYVIQDNVQWIHGSHSLTFGGQLLFQQDNNELPTGGSDILYINFNNTETAGFSPAGTLLTNTGNSYASYLLGLVDAASLQQNAAGPTGARSRNYAVYAQDDWKATRRLTLNLGLRYQVPIPITEAFNRESWFNPTQPNPAVGGYPGALQFAGYGLDSCQCKTRVQTHFKDFAPRVGFANQLNDKTVLRGAYGIIYWNDGALGDNGGDRQGSGILGFEASPTFTSLNGGISPAFNWNDGFPAYAHAPFFDPTLNTGFNTTTPSGGGITYDAPQLGGRSAYTENWNLTVQRELSPSTVLTAAYSASSSHFIATGIGRGIYSDQILPQDLALGNLLFAPAIPENIAAAQAIIPGIHLPYPNFQGSIGQMLRPFPQYASIGDPWGDIGNANYNSLQLSAQRRFSHGLSFLVSYTLSKEIDDAGSALGGFFGASGRTAYNNRLEKAVGGQDIPNQLVLSYVYQLPFGPGHKLASGNKVVNALIGNWQFSGIQSYIQGTPLGPFGAACNVPYTGGCYANYAPNFKGSVRINGSYGSGNLLGPTPPSFINVNAFANPAAFTFGDTPRTNAYRLRNTPFFDEDFSLMRDIKIRENLKFRIQADVFNAFNRVQFGCISTGITSSNFGSVGCQANSPRKFQFDAHLIF